MSIDKESSGLPEMDPQRATTKVNLAMVFAIGVFFFVILFGAVMYFSRRGHANSVQGQSAPIESQQSQPAKSR